MKIRLYAIQRLLKRSDRSIWWTIGVISVLVIAAHAVLIPAGRWDGDEFLLLLPEPDFWEAYIARVLGWSPRPLSEALLLGYGALVGFFDRPLIPEILLACWAALFAALALACRLGKLRGREIVTVCLTLPALLLMVAKPGEVFYWPAAAVAYLPTLAAMSFVVVLASASGGWGALAGATTGQRAALLIALLVGAGASELGACFALLLAAGSLSRGIAFLRRTGWVWLPPAVAGLAALLVFRVYRGHSAEVMLAGNPTLGSLAASGVAAIMGLVREFAAGLPSGDPTGYDVVNVGLWPVLIGLTLRVLLLLGLTRIGPPRLSWTAFDLMPAGALFGVCYVSLVSAYFNFGIACCERHETMRQAIFVLMTISVASALPGGRPELRGLALVLVLLVLVVARMPALRSDLRAMRAVSAATSANWESGRAQGDTMVFTLVPGLRVVNQGFSAVPGDFHLNLSGGVDAPGGYGLARILHFFGKSELLVRRESRSGARR